MLHQIKRFIPNWALDIYHRTLSITAAAIYGNPSHKMVVIGVTGTNGKTSTAYMIAKALEAGGQKTGCTTTALFKIADKEWLNDTKMTMLGRFALQKNLKQMLDAGCRYAVIEVSSQGIVQHRHEHIAFDIGVFTNLTPEHIEAHGGFENYKQAKINLFRHIASLPEKIVDGQKIIKAFILNKDDKYSQDFAVPGVDNIVWYGIDDKSDIKADSVEESEQGIKFKLGDNQINLLIPGKVNVYNSLAAIATAKALDIQTSDAIQALEKISNIPGRFELIDEGQSWRVMVDYAPEPESLKKVYETIKLINPKRLIHVLGSCGGGRDVARRPILGHMAGSTADIVIVTNEDPYDDDPLQIINQVATGAREQGKIEERDLFLIPDRKQAIYKSMELAQDGDLVLLTGKGCEQAICVAGGKKIPWDERLVAKEAIHSAVAKRAKSK
ncbi:UDP-N-acetylmuramoyl-L-alanyl-D-glutamate--2,6-diaminopimelate ligase [Patescibacteria group bacterium]|nr:UDP-N-acetylmuramoyl-L-alanyl-D-glutamate--2,6-diaminopimelate ligase [Patescibacteria group bacterium]